MRAATSGLIGALVMGLTAACGGIARDPDKTWLDPSGPGNPATGGSANGAGGGEATGPTRLDELLETLISAAEAEAPEDRPFIRYLTLIDRYDAAKYGIEHERPADDAERESALRRCELPAEGRPECAHLQPDTPTATELIAGDRSALSKVVNSLSNNWGCATDCTETRMVRPEPIGAEQSSYRIDLRDYGLNRSVVVDGRSYADGWEAIAAEALMAYELRGDAAERVKALTGTKVPFLFGGPFVAAATQGELYYGLLGVPESLDELWRQIGLSRAPDASVGSVTRAAFNTSGHSELPRVVERLGPAAAIPYWQVYDFRRTLDAGDAFSNPLAPIRADSTNVIFSLRNGLQGYLIADERGRRITESPLLTDPAQPDSVLRNGISCFACHQEGIVRFRDEIRPAAEAGQFGSDAVPAIEAVYPRPRLMDKQIESDNEYYARALQEAGVDTQAPDPVSPFFYQFRGPITRAYAASALLVTPERLLGKLPELSPALAPLGGGPEEVIERSSFDATYLDAFCTLYRGAKNLPAACP